MVMRRSDEAVSPIIGAVMLVAIAVLLAGGVFVMVRIFTDESVEKAPLVAFADDPEDPTLTVVRASPGLTWDELVLMGDCLPLLNGAAYPPAPGTAVESGDVLECQAGEVLRIASTHREDNTLLLDHDF